MIYQVQISKKASKQLKQLPVDIQERLESKIQQLAEDPRPDGVGKLKNGENRYRIRVGDYRILYDIYDDVLVVTVVRVGHRREVYRDE
ncbi:MAG: type II toxin-antitoxin system RelE/ParE family toxin [Nostoc sp.]|uniref:type II toxin-antitoxin system RelE family toxin n=1 Tax=Nostoc sp. TaxID=1180 RepID=UPI002FF7CBF6